MRKNKKVLEEVEKTLNSFDEISKLEDNPFLYTRIKSSIETEQLPAKTERKFSLKPVIIGLILIINFLTGIFFLQSDTESYVSEQSDIESLKQNYKIDQTYNEFISVN